MFVCVCVNLLLLVFALFSVLGSTPFHQSHTGFSQHGLSDFPRPVCVCSKLQCHVAYQLNLSLQILTMVTIRFPGCKSYATVFYRSEISLPL